MYSDLRKHEVNLHGRLPEFLTDFREMDALLTAEKPELELLFGSIERILDDFFIDTASEAALARYEKIMGLRVQAGDTLEARRLRVLLACGRVKKFTIAALIAAAASMGERVEVALLEGHRILIDFLSGNEANIAVLEKEFRASLPAHLEIMIRNINKFTDGMHIGGMLGVTTIYTFTEA